MAKTIWYISKYVTPPYAARVGSRGFLLLREFARTGHRAVLITSDSNHLANPPRFAGPRMQETVEGVEVHWLRTWKYRGARSLGRIISWIDFEWRLLKMPKKSLPCPDVLIVSSLSLLTILSGLWLRWKFGCKLVFEVRDIWPLTLTEVGKFSKRHPLVVLLGWVERLGYQRSDLIVGTMPNLGEHVREIAGSDVPKIVCIPQGLDPGLLSPPKALPEDYFERVLPADKFIVCHAGSVGADNALGTLMATARAMQVRLDIHFVVVGDGYMKACFQSETADLGNLTFADAVPKAAVQSVLARADLLYFAVHKSRHMRFGQSLNKVIDYMLAGKPIVASYSGFPSMVNEAGCGSFVPAEDVEALRAEIERYVDMSPLERAAIGGRGRDWVLQNRRFEVLAADYLRHLAEVGA